MPPPGYEPFLRAICAEPEDDVARLVYADWLDENGDPDRAEFIRVSIEWSRTAYPSEQWHRLREFVTSLVKLHGEHWLAEFPQRAGISWDTGFPWGPFHRGLPVMAAVLHGRMFAEHVERVFALAPVQHLVFPRVSLEVIRDALACPRIGGIKDFTVVWTGPNQRGDELCEVLAGCSHLRCLESLPLGRKWITDRGAAVLATASFLPHLREVFLANNPMSETGVLAIVDHLSAERVRRLVVPALPLSEDTRQVLRERFCAALQLE